MNIPDFKVMVKTNTFNHRNYITDTMNGLCMQQTDFPFLCSIIDDASTDGEQEVIRQYVEANFDLSEDSGACTTETTDAVVTFARHKTNEHCYFAVTYMKENLFSQHKSKAPYHDRYGKGCKYIAYCEGDDYWIDAAKLQKQVDVLDSHPEVLLVYTGFKTVDEKGQEIERPNFDFHQRKSRSGDILCLLLRSNFVQTLTICMRRDCTECDFLKRSHATLDYAYALAAAINGDVWYLPEETGCYRKTSTGAMATMQGILSVQAYAVFRFTATEILNGNCKPLPFHERQKIYFEITFKFLRYLFSGRRDALSFVLSHPKLYIHLLPALVFCLYRAIETRVLKIRSFR